MLLNYEVNSEVHTLIPLGDGFQWLWIQFFLCTEA